MKYLPGVNIDKDDAKPTVIKSNAIYLFILFICYLLQCWPLRKPPTKHQPTNPGI